jgi:hypothetical protein
MVKELGLLKIVVPDEFVAGSIIAKLPLSWMYFAITLKHKRVHMFISDLITSLDVEEKTWAKDERSKGAEAQTSANLVHQPQSKGKGKQNKKNNNKPRQSTTFKKKKIKENKGCFMCGLTDHWAKKCSNHKGRKLQPEQKTVNMVTGAGGGTSGYGNLPSVLLVSQSTT